MRKRVKDLRQLYYDMCHKVMIDDVNKKIINVSRR